MGDLSYNFNHKDFACRCPQCKGEYRVHLGLVGALEMIAAHFNKKPKILSAFFCEAYTETLKRERLSFHSKGKAVNISIDGVPLAELFNFAEGLPEINGLGFYPEEKMVHLDTRPAEKRELWIKERDKYSPLSADKRQLYGLNKITDAPIPHDQQ